jgi:catechol 2,3-dioxygenase-like lactoylglutathione lyase family enzyme
MTATARSSTDAIRPPPFAVAGRMAVVTVGTPALAASIEAYRTVFGFRTIEEGRVSQTQAAAWLAPAQAGRAFAVMGPARAEGCVFRFVETPAPPETFAPFTTYGWAAAEIAVADVEALHVELAHSPFAIVNPPSSLNFTSPIRPMQASGPAGEGLYLNEILGESPRYHLPKAEAKVDQVFIMILATRDRAAAADYYERTIGLEKSADYTIQYNTLNKAFGLPPDTKHSFVMTKCDALPAVQIDELPAAARLRPAVDGAFPPGIAMVSFLVDAARFDAAAGEAYAPPSCIAPAQAAKMLIGPAGERIELLAFGAS